MTTSFLRLKFIPSDDKIKDMANQATFGETSFNVGDQVRVSVRLIEQEKKGGKTKREERVEQRERIQAFDGVVLAIRGEGENKSFTVRRMGVGGIGIERIFPLSSPWITKIEVKKKGDVRRAKLYYLRGKKKK